MKTAREWAEALRAKRCPSGLGIHCSTCTAEVFADAQHDALAAQSDRLRLAEAVCDRMGVMISTYGNEDDKAAIDAWRKARGA